MKLELNNTTASPITIGGVTYPVGFKLIINDYVVSNDIDAILVGFYTQSVYHTNLTSGAFVGYVNSAAVSNDAFYQAFSNMKQTYVGTSKVGQLIVSESDAGKFVSATASGLAFSTLPASGGVALASSWPFPASTTGTADVYYLSLAGTVPNGDYILVANFMWSYDAMNSSFIAKLKNYAVDLGSPLVIQPKSSSGTGPYGTDQRLDATVMKPITVTGGAVAIDLTFASGVSGIASAIYEATLILLKA